jgi:hypothetical protein
MLVMKNQKEDLASPYRALFTEVLPYEVPILFDNQGFFKIVNQKDYNKIFEKVIGFDGLKNSYSIPFEYTIRRNGGKKVRLLSVMHPMHQRKVADFYQRNQNMLLYYCSKSPFSLRYIDNVSRIEYNKMLETDKAPERDENENNVIELKDDEQEQRYKSYFVYKKYDMNYKFFKSMDFLRLEQKYPFMQKADIAQCFYHIYTHSISWAIKGKSAAKSSINVANFQNEFDRLMQCTNYNETNGILVGPEISRIFAEIILQRVDNELAERMRNKGKQLFMHYEVRRYVDDYMIFSVDKQTAEECLSELKDTLAEYKLFLNESKNELVERPFMSTMACARQQLSDKFKEWTASLFNLERNEYSVRAENKILLKWIRSFEAITTHYGLVYGDVNRYILSVVKNFLTGCVSKDVKESGAKVTYDFLLLFTEFSFGVYTFDMSCTATMRICYLMSIIIKIATQSLNQMDLMALKDLMNREVKRCLDIYTSQHITNTTTNIEMCNLLSVATAVTNFKLSNSLLDKLFPEGKSLDYFQICTALCLVKNEQTYDKIRDRIIEGIKQKFSMVPENDRNKYSELTMLFLDMMTCPYLKNKEKDEIVKLYSGKEITNSDKISARRNEVKKCGTWFFHWGGQPNIDEFMKKKEYTPDYY